MDNTHDPIVHDDLTKLPTTQIHTGGDTSTSNGIAIPDSHDKQNDKNEIIGNDETRNNNNNNNNNNNISVVNNNNNTHGFVAKSSDINYDQISRKNIPAMDSIDTKKFDKLIRKFITAIGEFNELLHDDLYILEKIKMKKSSVHDHFMPKYYELQKRYDIIRTINLSVITTLNIRDYIGQIYELNYQLHSLNIIIRRIHPEYSSKIARKLRHRLHYDFARPITNYPNEQIEVDIGIHRRDINQLLKRLNSDKLSFKISAQSTYLHEILLPKQFTLIWFWECGKQSYLDFQLTHTSIVDDNCFESLLIPFTNRIWTSYSMFRPIVDGTAKFLFSNKLSLFKSKTIKFKSIILPPEYGDQFYDNYCRRIHHINEISRRSRKSFPLDDGHLSVTINLQNSKFFEIYTFTFTFVFSITFEWNVNLSYNDLVDLYEKICISVPNDAKLLPQFPRNIFYLFLDHKERLIRSKEMDDFFQEAFSSKGIRELLLEFFDYHKIIRTSKNSYENFLTDQTESTPQQTRQEEAKSNDTNYSNTSFFDIQDWSDIDEIR